ncbi:MAG: SusC/RagA family TonB-linked outer membrane protein, partial [Tannerella sp.]|nr:SusC/RagA family TonB-linked outer membrane protein [Tannerella sp.]
MTKQNRIHIKELFTRKSTLTVIITMLLACLFTTHAEQLSLHETQQAQPISGVVRDQNGDPVIGATVLEKGNSDNGTITNVNGEFSIQIAPNGILKISYIGYITQEVNVRNEKSIQITLHEDVQNLEEVVVVGYGTQKKVNLTGSVSVVSGQDITSKSSTDVVNAMMGQIPGLLVTRNSGQPGSEIDGTASIRIRGFTSVNDAQALVLIDGVEGLLHTLNAEDIESISVLKDAASASIYGSRAAAGVILVTTKKGFAEKTKVTYNGSFGINVPGLMLKRVPPWEDYEWIHQSLYNVNPAFVINREAVDMIANPNHKYRVMGTRWEEYYANNWMHLGMKEYTTQQTHSVSVTGGNNKTQYYVSGGFYTKSGILQYGPDKSNRVNFRSSLNTEINKYLDFNIQVAYEGIRKKEVAYSGGEAGRTSAEKILGLLYTKAGYHGLYNPEEDTYYDIDPYSNGSSANPIQIMKEGGEIKNQYHYFTGFAGLRVKNVVKDLTLDLNFSRRAGFEAYEGDYRFIKGHGRNGAARPTDVNNPQRVIKRKANSYQDKFEALLNYDLNTGKHHIHLLGGASYEQYLRDYMSAEARNGISNDFFSFNYYASNEAANTVLSDAIQPWKMASLFGRVNYDFAGRYLLEANLRYDGSSRLSPGNRWGLFPSASVGWRISEETFFEGAKKFIDNLKLRASWGTLGNST